MSLLFESIRIQDGMFDLLDLHEERMRASRKALLGLDDPISLHDLSVPAEYQSGRVKCRVEYTSIIERVTFERYELSLPKQFRLVTDNEIEYAHKFTDRTRLLALLESATPDGIIIVRGGFITDSYHANLVFSDGSQWVTPDTPLLKGRMRESLLRTGQISLVSVRPENLKSYTSFKLINAMLGFKESPEFSFDRIVGI